MDTEIHQKLEDISLYFGLGSIQVSKRGKGTNQNYYVRTDTGQYLFKILINATREEALEDIQTGIPYLDRLEQYRFPAATYIKAANGSPVYDDGTTIAVALHKLDGIEPEASEDVCREVGVSLAKLNLIPTAGLTAKRHWLESDYLPQSIEKAKKIFGEEKLRETIREYELLQHFKPATFPQSIIHGDLDPSNCLFSEGRISAFLDWQESGIGASILDFGMTVLGFCFTQEATSPATMTFLSNLYNGLFEGYSQIRLFSSYEEEHIEAAVKYAGLTIPVWFMLHWETYFPGEDLEETKLFYWKYGLHHWKLVH